MCLYLKQNPAEDEMFVRGFFPFSALQKGERKDD